MNTTFYMVWKDGGDTPTYQHLTLDAAKREAERLARTVGGRFYVLRAVALCEKRDVFWDELQEDDDRSVEVPF